MSTPLQGLDQASASKAFVQWLHEQRRLHPRLLAGAPGLRLLVTSRGRLDIAGECCLPLAGLHLPARPSTSEQALNSPAVRLFAHRARAVQPRFDIGRSLTPVVNICRRVGGLPLAIERAAAWMRVLAAQELARDIADGATSTALSRPAAVFESSWRLRPTAAVPVAGVELPLLAALVDKSMLRASPDGRLDMHPLVLDHASSKFARLEAAPELALRHAHWYLALLQQRQPLPPQENENVLAAWRRMVRQGDETAVEAALKRIQWTAVVDGRRGEAATGLVGHAARPGPHGRSPG